MQRKGKLFVQMYRYFSLLTINLSKYSNRDKLCVFTLFFPNVLRDKLECIHTDTHKEVFLMFNTCLYDCLLPEAMSRSTYIKQSSSSKSNIQLNDTYRGVIARLF